MGEPLVDVPPGRERRSEVPAWLPRSGFVGAYLIRGAVVAQGRLQWVFPFYEERADMLGLVVEAGGGPAVVLPSTLLEGYDFPINSFYLYTAQVGLTYRNQARSGLQWGFQFTSGPVWYGGRFRDVPDEDLLAGLIDGRLHLGYKMGPVVLSLAAGWGEPYSFRRRNLSRGFLGGPQVGLLLDWRLGGP